MGVIAKLDGALVEDISYFNGETDARNTKYVNGQTFGQISTSSSFVSFDNTGQTVYGNVTSSGAWWAYIYDDQGDSSWVGYFDSSGPAGYSAVSFEAFGNGGTNSRFVVIRYVCGSGYVDITYCQDGTLETCV